MDDIDLVAAVPPEQRRRVDRDAPETFVVPSGRKVRTEIRRRWNGVGIGEAARGLRSLKRQGSARDVSQSCWRSRPRTGGRRSSRAPSAASGIGRIPKFAVRGRSGLCIVDWTLCIVDP